FVLYRPPLRSATWVLWFGPGVLLVCLLGGLVLRIRNLAGSGSRGAR
ncbi:cytochrome c-type biogenesis protein CcmH, partial [Yersinia enterocolitica]